MSTTTKKWERLARWLSWMAFLGLVVFVGSVEYEVYTFRTSPKAPDQNHSLVWIGHGDQRYVTPAQDKLHRRMLTTGAAMAIGCGLAAVLLYTRGKFNGTTSSRANKNDAIR